MRKAKAVVVFALLLGLCSLVGAQEFAEDFESYEAGSQMHGQGGWKGWDNVESAGALASDLYAFSGSISVAIGGPTDLVHEFDVSGGKWELKMMQYIPSGTTGDNDVILMNVYNDVGVNEGAKDWSVVWPFSLGSGTVTSQQGGGSAVIVYDQWVEVKFIIRLDDNVVDGYYNGELLASHIWDDNEHGTFQAIDLWGNNASLIYYDDITLTRYYDYKAANPVPADGAVGVSQPMVQWTPGDTAMYHNVYFGTSPDLTEADLVAEKTRSLLYYHFAGLESGVTYYWRVDEVEADGTTIHEGDVWSFTSVPVAASQPAPADGARFQDVDVDLAWTPGDAAASHDVYFGAVRDEVVNGTGDTFMGNVHDPEFELDTLELGVTYYWRVDEVEADGATIHEGDVWSFRTVPVIPIDDPNLVGWWTLDEGQGTKALDWSGHGLHGTFVGEPEWIPGYDGGGLELPGSADYVDIGNSTLFPDGAEPRSMCGWGRTNTVASGYRWIAAYGSAGTGLAMFIGINGTTLYGGGYGDDVTKTNFWQVGEWRHICLTYDGSQARLYADGEQVASASKSWNLARSRAHIGRQVNDAAEYWNGAVDDVRIYNIALTPEQVKAAMRGDTTRAWRPTPASGYTVDSREVPPLTWSAGDDAVQHDVYLGTDGLAVDAADASDTTGVYRGRQNGTSFTPAEPLEWGQTYYWRIDEVNADGSIVTGRLWSFTVADYIIVDDFESYTNNSPDRIFQTWVDGLGFSKDDYFPNDNPGNGSGAAVGHDVWSSDSAYYQGQIAEIAIVHSGRQSMPLYYDNSVAPHYSEAERTYTTAQNWTANGVESLILYVRGVASNAAESLYLVVEDSAGHRATMTYPETTPVTTAQWTGWKIPLSDFVAEGLNMAAVKKIIVGLGNRTNPTVGGEGLLYIDDIRVILPPEPVAAFEEDFESYAAGSDLHGQGGWKGWDDTDTAGAPASGTYANSGDNSVEIISSADLVHEFDVAGGVVEMTAMQYIPSGGTGESFFILLNTYNDGGDKDWSVQTKFNMDTGLVTSNYDDEASVEIVYDQWVELKFVIDLDTNTVDEYYDGTLWTSHVWDDDAHGTLQAIDLWGNNASSVYYDDIVVE